MDASTIQSRIYMGYGKVASKIGSPYGVYRAQSALADAISAGNLLTTIPASFNAEDMKYGKPNKYGHPTWYCVADGTSFRVGDYLVGESTFLVVAMQPMLPILVVETNRTISIFRPQKQLGIGALGYGGNTQYNQEPTLVNFPASVLQGTKGEVGPAKLPGDTRLPWFYVLMPAIPGGELVLNNDLIVDDLGRRYITSSTELTDLGWRITATQATA